METKHRPSKALVQPVDLPIFADERGLLVAIETLRDVPFAIERVYWIIARVGEARGFHAHRALQQLMVCIAGKCRIVIDNGFERFEIVLDRADQGLFVGAMEWHEMHDFSAECVLMVLASAHYDEADYIRDYAEFRALAGVRLSGG